MSNLAFLALLCAPAHHHHLAPPAPCVGHGLVSAFVPKPHGCYGYHPGGCCGVIAPHLLAGPPAPNVTLEEAKVWGDYLNELDGQDRIGLMVVWQQADRAGRRKLLGQVAKLRADQARKPADEKKPESPISNQEQKKWDGHLATLAGDELANARKAWAAADAAGKRRLLKLTGK